MPHANHQRPEGGGLNGGEYCPPLALLTGALEQAWQVLEPDHRDYKRWWGAWQLQDGWSPRTHRWFWSTELERWPRNTGKPTTRGLYAARAALWLRAGYTRAQIEAALGYGRKCAPGLLWTRARDYADWLEQADWIERQAEHQGHATDFLPTIAWHEELCAAGVEQRDVGGLRLDLGADFAASHTPEQARRWFRRRWRVPRVLTQEEHEQVRFGLPEPFSARLLYTELDRQRVELAERQLQQLAA